MFALPVTFIKLLSADTYVTFLAEFNNKKCVVKFFPDGAPHNNEYTTMLYMQENSKHPEWYPKPYFQFHTELKEYAVKTADNKEHKILDVYEIICYEYFEGLTCDDLARDFVLDEARIDLSEHLADLHKLGFVMADVHYGNIIYNTKLRRYQLIDYGQTFHVSNPAFSFPGFTKPNGDPLIPEDDRRDLEVAIRVIEGIRYSILSKYDIGMILNLTLKSLADHLTEK